MQQMYSCIRLERLKEHIQNTNVTGLGLVALRGGIGQIDGADVVHTSNERS